MWEDGYPVRTVGNKNNMTATLAKGYVRRHDDEQANNEPKLFCEGQLTKPRCLGGLAHFCMSFGWSILRKELLAGS